MNFEQACERVKHLSRVPTNTEKLVLYALYKQATIGNVQGSQPWKIQVEPRAKWDAWATQRNKSQDQAKREYIQYVADLIKKYP